MTKVTILALALLLSGHPVAAEPIMPGCTYEYGGFSVDPMAQDGSPVIFQWFTCRDQLRRRYVDFTGRELSKQALVPNERYVIVDYLEELLGIDIDMTTEIERLEAIATERGLM